jgi:hypothetical protein
MHLQADRFSVMPVDTGDKEWAGEEEAEESGCGSGDDGSGDDDGIGIGDGRRRDGITSDQVHETGDQNPMSDSGIPEQDMSATREMCQCCTIRAV